MTSSPDEAVRLGARRPAVIQARTGRAALQLGSRRVPLFRSIGIGGYYAALLVALLASFLADVNPVAVLGLSAAAGASFFLWALLRRAVTGRETLVLLEHVWVAGAAVAAFCAAAGIDVLAGLDVLACGIAVFLGVGRVGCFAVGCCYGVPSDVGVAYPADAGLPARLAGVKLVPVQLIEAAALVLIAAVALGLASGPAGEATVWFLLAYAVVRFGTEGLRADDRPRAWGLSVPRWMCLVQAAGAGALAVAAVPGADYRVVIAAAVVLVPVALAGLVLAIRRRPTALARPEKLDESWSVIQDLAGLLPAADQPAVAATRSGVRVAVSCLPVADRGRGPGHAVDVHVSLSSQRWTQAELLAVGYVLGGLDVRPGEWAVHFRLSGPRLGLGQLEEPLDQPRPDMRITSHTGSALGPEAEGYFGRWGDEQSSARTARYPGPLAS